MNGLLSREVAFCLEIRCPGVLLEVFTICADFVMWAGSRIVFLGMLPGMLLEDSAVCGNFTVDRWAA